MPIHKRTTKTHLKLHSNLTSSILGNSSGSETASLLSPWQMTSPIYFCFPPWFPSTQSLVCQKSPSVKSFPIYHNIITLKVSVWGGVGKMGSLRRLMWFMVETSVSWVCSYSSLTNVLWYQIQLGHSTRSVHTTCSRTWRI